MEKSLVVHKDIMLKLCNSKSEPWDPKSKENHSDELFFYMDMSISIERQHPKYYSRNLRKDTILRSIVVRHDDKVIHAR
jgi:hypothetical protein